MKNNFFSLYLFKGINIIFSRPSRAFQIVKNFLYDLKYTRNYMGIPLNNENKISGFTNTTSTEYFILEKLFSKVDINDDDVIVDVGCGKGRVLAWLANKVQNKIIGVEVDIDVAQQTRKKMYRYKQVEILIGNIVEEAFPSEGTIFYLFNPFNESILTKFVKKIEDNFSRGKSQNKRIIIIYYNCCHLGVFEENRFWKINRIDNFNELPAAIIMAEYQ